MSPMAIRLKLCDADILFCGGACDSSYCTHQRSIYDLENKSVDTENAYLNAPSKAKMAEDADKSLEPRRTQS